MPKQMLINFIQEGHVKDVTPKVMQLIKGRLEHILIRLSTARPNDPILRDISQTLEYTRQVSELMAAPVASSSTY